MVPKSRDRRLLSPGDVEPTIARDGTRDVVAPPQEGGRRWGRGLAVIGLLGAALLVPLLRQTGTSSWRAISFEDGSIYTTQALARGPVAVLFRGYNGYVQLPPRLWSLLVPFVPLRHLPAYLALAGALTVALLAGCVFWTTKGLIDSTPVRALLAALVVLAPVMGWENTANITNTIWTFLAVTPLMLVSLQEGRRATVARSIVVFLAATSTPLVALIVPLAIGWAIYRRTRSSYVVGGAMAAGLVVQAISVLTSENPATAHGGSVAEIRDRVAFRVFGEIAVGPRWASQLWLSNWRALEVGSVLVFFVIFALVFPGAGRRAQALASTFVAYGIATFVVPLWGRGAEIIPGKEGGAMWNLTMRFSVAPCFLLVSALAMLLASPERAARSLRVEVTKWVVVAQVLLLMAVNFRTRGFVSGETDWHQQVAAVYEQDCRGKPSNAVVTIPEGYYPVMATCADLAP
jgi:hypothetical protein